MPASEYDVFAADFLAYAQRRLYHEVSQRVPGLTLDRVAVNRINPDLAPFDQQVSFEVCDDSGCWVLMKICAVFIGQVGLTTTFAQSMDGFVAEIMKPRTAESIRLDIRIS